MTRKERLKIKKSISTGCCEHYVGSNAYLVGYVRGLKFCKVAVCKDCGTLQVLNRFVGTLLTWFLGPLQRDAVEIIEEMRVL